MSSDDFDDSDERFGRRKDRRRPKGGRRRQELVRDGKETAGGAGPFEDSGLNYLHRKGLLQSLGNEVRPGKEATVYRAEGPQGPLAAKIYSDPEVRGFHAEESYEAGRYVADRRVRKLLGNASRRGLSPQLAHWVFNEYRMLWWLLGADVTVPRPALGPEPVEMVEAGRVVLMEWVGAEEPAPRLADVQLEASETTSAWHQSRSLLVRLLAEGLVHGDLSTYNLLWWEGRVVLIDLPQTVEAARNPNASALLERDARTLCSSFRALGVDEDPAALLAEVRSEAGYSPSGPLRLRQ